ncbi:hypothetical protein [Halocella sp. SP3-1]|uniref:hypothetical protein n=1 Tax=Halocella sp. SP3-1 TaxID=2382161 RepID=UPI000F764343|nr:hypothetical protein [Halocella sp. SP3-1]AZO95065.1 hypothetical protein D7D81_10950 [Halocella sp. SP3-1]
MYNKRFELVFLFLISIILLLLTACESVPTDDILINNFREHKSDFKKLITMFRQDKELGYISQKIISPMDAVSEERKKEYRDLLKELKIKQIKSYDKNENIAFNVYAVGLSVTGAAKGYEYWGKQIPAHLELVRNLDEDYQKEREKDEPLAYYKFRHIEGHWYLYYSVDD